MTSESGQDAAPMSITGSVHRFLYAAVVLISAIVYWPSIRGGMIWDDSEILSGKGIGNAASFLDCFSRPFLYHYYRPLTSLSFLIDRRIWNSSGAMHTIGCHLTNIVLHAATTAVLMALLHRLFQNYRITLLG